MLEARDRQTPSDCLFGEIESSNSFSYGEFRTLVTCKVDLHASHQVMDRLAYAAVASAVSLRLRNSRIAAAMSGA